VLGRYHIIERVGSGGFGVVWRAWDELLDRDVAVKQIWLGPEGDLQRAARETQAIARLSHPAIVNLYEMDVVEDTIYLVSEFVAGGTLNTMIGRLNDQEVFELGVALTGALSHAHAHGVIHRDIKPENILLYSHPKGSGWTAKLIDFGSASLVGGGALSVTGDVIGTLAYMSPEQAEGRRAHAESDLYSLALVLYETLSGVNPVRGPTPATTARRIGAHLEPLHHHRRDLPRALTRALDNALSPNPQSRGTLARLRMELERARKHD
jgi:eukaryotic-like serine/threonine-protein kinase